MRLPLALAAGSAVAGSAAWTLPALACHVPPLAVALRVLRHDGDAVALTFDDGPHPEGTPAVLVALERAGAPATFFLVGEQVERNPRLAAEVAAAGHAIALHGFRHRNQLRLGAGAVREDLRRGAAAIEEATGVSPTIYRPPYGIFSAGGLRAVRAAGYTPWLWSRWGRDWRADATPEGIAAKATEDLGPGDVVLLHDADHYSAGGSHRRTAAALPRILEAVAGRGLRAGRL
ncbi:MAG TPA: polysaccharide deacetylase family protein [Solirubrobacteraceae bacterium]|nr:polysaccharide deacetylase family protein [Solirubrobacteraceae bacterium]